MFNLNFRFAQLGAPFTTIVTATPLIVEPHLAHFNQNLAIKLNLESISLDDWCDILSANQIIDGYPALASVYMGHQFGYPVAQLGDGRAMLIAEHQTIDKHIYELQLKGAGVTPYSRSGDGRAVLRSSIREYLASHAMQQLACPTTQALALLHSHDKIYREQIETAGVVLRVAPSFLRFGHFEYYAKHGLLDELRKLVEFSVINYFPEIDIKAESLIPQFLKKVVQLTVQMIAKWQSLGFVHGVMNTDNMSILGLTIDYGPYAFLDAYDPLQIFNHSDSDGRYTYANQPDIAWWNLYRLAEALLEIYPDTKSLQQVLDSYADEYNQQYLLLMGQKLGLLKFSKSDDKKFLDELLQIMFDLKIDWTYFWRCLSKNTHNLAQIKEEFNNFRLDNWLDKLQQRYEVQNLDTVQRQKMMLAINPALALRNAFLEDVIELAKKDDYSLLDLLFRAFDNPYQESQEFEQFYQIPKNQSPVILSCSS